MKYMWILFLGIFISCNGCRDKQQASEMSYEEMQRELIETNKAKLKEEKAAILKFIDKKKWKVTETGTGLFYEIYQKGAGKKAVEGDIVVLAYTVSLLDGKVCYTSTPENPSHFKVGEDNVETGLHEMVQYMSVGDKAHVVLPSHRAFGFTGDSSKIPQDASVVYDIELLAIEQP